MPDPQDNPSLVADCETLLELRDALAGDGTLNWSESIPLTAWQGVVIGDSPQRVVRVRLVGNGLTGTVPSELGKLSGLRTLKLDHNQLTGVIPQELAELTELEVLDLGANALSGEIPGELGELRNLRELWLANNMLTGKFPEQLKSLGKLAAMDLYGNDLFGCIPKELRSVEGNFGGLPYCVIVWSDRPVLKGGIDLGVTYIERLPRYQRYQLAYPWEGDCPYPFDEFKGAVVCPWQADIKRWPNPGEPIELIAHVWNFGNWPSGPFDYEWKLNDKTLEASQHGGLESGEYAEFVLLTEWPGDESNPTATFRR